MKFKCLATALALSALGSTVHAAPAWITIGERAHALLLETAPQARELSRRDVTVPEPVAPNSRSTRAAVERVYAMEVDETALEALSEAVHDRLKRCGGFIRHDSPDEALATLRSVQGTAAMANVPSYTIGNQAAVNALLPQMQSSLILSTIDRLSAYQNRRHTSTHGVDAANWLTKYWSALAETTRVHVTVTQVPHTWAQSSVVLEIRGGLLPNEVVVLGGHLDSTASGNAQTVRAPGADDDASGVASMSEVIRVLLKNNHAPKRTIRFIAYAAEEAGLLGSKAIANAARAANAPVVGVMQLDMTAYKGSAQDLWIYTDYTHAGQNQFVADLAATYLPELTVGYDRCGYGCSDHASWTAAGYPASFPFESADATYNRSIHTANDTIATFGGTADHALKFAKLALAYVVELANAPAPVQSTPAATKLAPVQEQTKRRNP